MGKRRVLARDIPKHLEIMADNVIAGMPQSAYDKWMIDPLLAAMDGAKDPAEAEAAVLAAFDVMDATVVEKVVQQAIVTADLIGTVAARPVKTPPLTVEQDGENEVPAL